MTRVVITDCGDSSYWYNDYIGEEFDAIEVTDRHGAKVRAPSGYLNYIRPDDYVEV